MKREDVVAAAAEARRFLDRVDAVLEETDRPGWLWGTKATGAMRRASMDLTRSLAVMRGRAR